MWSKPISSTAWANSRTAPASSSRSLCGNVRPMCTAGVSARGPDCDDRFDLDCHPGRKRGDADRRPRVSSLRPEELDKEVGRAVDHLRLVLESRRARDEADHLDDLLDAVEPSELLLECAQDVQRAELRGQVAVLDGDVLADVAEV